MSRLQPLAQPFGAGSVILYRRISGWVTAPGPAGEDGTTDRRAPLKRLGALGAAGYVVAASDYTSWALYAGTGAWIVGALMLGARPEPAPRPAAATQATDAPDPGESPAVDIPAAVRATCGPHSGSHLSVLAQYLTKTTRREWDIPAVRAACTATGIPIETVRMGTGPGAVTKGVRLRDLPDPSPGPSPEGAVAVVAAGQSTATHPATATATPAATPDAEDQERGFQIVQDEENPHRHHVISLTPNPR